MFLQPARQAASRTYLRGRVRDRRGLVFTAFPDQQATFVVHTRSELLDPRQARRVGRAQKTRDLRRQYTEIPRPKMYVRYEPLLIAEAGIDVTP